jgi:predicted RNA-binding Zn ribbon-like protein
MKNRFKQRTNRNKKPAFDDFQFISGSLALDFVNTIANRLGEPRECLANADEFNRWARMAGLLAKHETLIVASGQLRKFKAAREELYGIFRPLALGKPPSVGAIARLNLMFSRVAGKRQLERVSGKIQWTWRMSKHDPDRILGPILLSASGIFVSGLYGKLRECGDRYCGWIFLDRSHAGCRRWCSMSDCGNRAKARESYRRKKVARVSDIRGRREKAFGHQTRRR